MAGVAQVAANPTADLQFVPSAFTNTVAGRFATGGRNNLIALSQWNVDFSTLKDFRIAETRTGAVQRAVRFGEFCAFH